MSQGQSQHPGLMMMNRAFSRCCHVTAFVCVAGAILEVIGYQGSTTAALWPALIPLAATLAALAVLDRFNTTFYSILYLVVGGASLYLFAVVMTADVPAVSATNAVPLNLVRIALILVTGSSVVPIVNAVWSVLGFVVGVAATISAVATTHVEFRLDAVSITGEIVLVAILVTIALTRTNRLRVQPNLDRAAIDEELSELRYHIEVRAAALMHDMVLNHLAAVAASEGEELRPELARQMEKDLQVLIGEEWLSDPSPEVDSQERRDWRRSSLLAAVQDARELSLTVEVTGDFAAVGRLSPERDVAVGLAVKQCLVNVLRHAQVERAEVVIIGSQDEVSVMVIDAGRGFSEHLVATDRLGLKQSVHRRIESVGGEVRLWSTPGRGTSVIIRVPATAATDRVGVSYE
jgi:signal transduction histidine kinase